MLTTQHELTVCPMLMLCNTF